MLYTSVTQLAVILFFTNTISSRPFINNHIVTTSVSPQVGALILNSAVAFQICIIASEAILASLSLGVSGLRIPDCSSLLYIIPVIKGNNNNVVAPVVLSVSTILTIASTSTTISVSSQSFTSVSGSSIVKPLLSTVSMLPNIAIPTQASVTSSKSFPTSSTSSTSSTIATTSNNVSIISPPVVKLPIRIGLTEV